MPPKSTGASSEQVAKVLARQSAGTGAGVWDEEAAAHIGAASSLLPPSEGSRSSRRRVGEGGKKFKRAGWAALDEPQPNAARLSASGRKRPSGKRKTKAELAAENAAAAEARSSSGAVSKASAGYDGGAFDDDAAEAAADGGAKKRPRTLFPEDGDGGSGGMATPPPSRSAGGSSKPCASGGIAKASASSSSNGGGTSSSCSSAGAVGGSGGSSLASGMSEKKAGKRVTLVLDAIDEEFGAPTYGPLGENEYADDGADDAEDGDGREEGGVKVEGEGDALDAAGKALLEAAARKKRNRAKKLDEGDTKELKPRHLKGKKREEQHARVMANLEACQARQRATAARSSLGGGWLNDGLNEEEEADPSVVLRERLARLLRPKLRRWIMYEWFHSPVDHAWLRSNEFLKQLQEAGLGHVCKLTRREWCFIRGLLGKPRRLSDSFFHAERERLNDYRDHVRSLRKLQAAGHAAAAQLEAELGLHGCVVQMAVGQRVTAFHPKERQLHPGTILTPDGDHYRVQFDKPKLGVQHVKDVLLMPLLDGSRGIDFTSPHGQLDAQARFDQVAGSWDAELKQTGGAAGAPAAAAAAGGGGIADVAAGADKKELQLLAYTLRLLDRKRLLLDELRAVTTEAERELQSVGKAIEAAIAEGSVPLHVSEYDLAPEHCISEGRRRPIKVEVTAAQQRLLGQVIAIDCH